MTYKRQFQLRFISPVLCFSYLLISTIILLGQHPIPIALHHGLETNEVEVVIIYSI